MCVCVCVCVLMWFGWAGDMHESLRLVNNTCGVLWNSPLIFIVSCHLGHIRQEGDVLEVVRIGFGTCRQILNIFQGGGDVAGVAWG